MIHFAQSQTGVVDIHSSCNQHISVRQQSARMSTTPCSHWSGKSPRICRRVENFATARNGLSRSRLNHEPTKKNKTKNQTTHRLRRSKAEPDDHHSSAHEQVSVRQKSCSVVLSSNGQGGAVSPRIGHGVKCFCRVEAYLGVGHGLQRLSSRDENLPTGQQRRRVLIPLESESNERDRNKLFG